MRAAYAAQQALVDEQWAHGEPLLVRMALHTGEVHVRDDGTYAGVAINRCARLRALAHGGQVLVSSATHDMVVDHLPAELGLQDLGVHRLRDLSRPEHIWQLLGPALTGDHPALRSLDATPNNLPIQLSSFVGRDADIARGTALLGETRLLTLTGAGGCGKTRLAQRVAAEVVDRHPAGVWWVELGPISDEALIADTVLTSLGLKSTSGRTAAASLADHLVEGPTLLVLDNCEHVVKGVAEFVDQLLRSIPGMGVLATSREPLAVEGEVTWRVPSLDLPPDFAGAPESLEQYDAVRLFIDRALQARPNFRVTNDNAPAVAQICRRLDGIPLAIELAAARTRSLPPERIAAELGDRFRLLTGHSRVGVPRQQTLLASVDWSHELLDPAERAALRRLSAFAGGFGLDAAEAVVGGDPIGPYDVLDVLTRLVDKSLVQLDDAAGPGRYRLLETIRQYALDRLTESGETEAVRDRHLLWACGLADRLEADVTDAHPWALDQLDAEQANLAAALDWAVVAGRREDGLGLLGALPFFFAQRGHYAEAATWASRILDTGQPPALAPPDPLTARARWGCAYVRFYGGDALGALDMAQVALEEARSVSDDSTAARALHTMNTAMFVVDPAVAREGLLESVALARAAGDEWCLADALQMVAYTLLAEGEHRAAEGYLAEAYEICDRRGNEFQRGWHHAALGWGHTLRAELADAEQELRRAIQLAGVVGDPVLEVLSCTLLCSALVAQGRPAALAAVVEQLEVGRHDQSELGRVLVPTFTAWGRLLEDPRGALGHLEAAASSLATLGDMLDSSALMAHAAMAAMEGGAPDDAARTATAGESYGPTALLRAQSRLLRGVAARAVGDPEALAMVHDALGTLAEHQVVLGVPLALEALGGIAVEEAAAPTGARLLAAAEALRRSSGQGRLPFEQRRFDLDVGCAREALGDLFETLWDEGTAQSAADAVSYARRARGERKRPTSGWESLTPTERQVVDLVADGLTNPEIGARLFISRGTVKTHLAHVFAKLGVSTRAELAGLAGWRSSVSERNHCPRDRRPLGR